MGVTLNILIGAAGLLLGAVAGWRLRKAGLAESPQLEPVEEQKPETEEPSEPAEPEAPEVDVVQEMMVRLQELTQSVKLDVGVHNSQIQEISEELTAVEGTEDGVIAVVEKLVRANETMQAQLNSAEERLEEQSREMEAHVQEARTDALTTLFNRRAFDAEMFHAEEELRYQNRPTSVLMIDVDHFKKFNDTYGHSGGDEVLRGVAGVLRKNLSEEEVICRYGGEEFAVIFPGGDIEAARVRGEQARAAIGKETFHFDGMDLRVSASAGLAQLHTGETAGAMIRRADEALYVCKKLGRDCGHWHDGQQSHPMSKSAVPIEPEVTTPEPAVAMPSEDQRDRISGMSAPVSFREDVDRRVAEFKRGGSSISLLLVEVDNYVVLVEEFAAGGVASTATAQFLRATMRDMDHIAQFEDGRFALLLPGARIHDACVVAERLRRAVERCHLEVGDQTLQFTVSLAIVEAASHDDTQELFDRATASLAKANDVGGNCTFIGEDNGEFNQAPPCPADSVDLVEEIGNVDALPST